MAASGFLSNDNVRYYHPADDFTEFTETVVWDDTNVTFVSGLFTSGIQADSSTLRLNQVLGSNYTDIQNANSFTVAVWTSGFLRDDSLLKLITVGFGNSGGSARNAIRLVKNGSNITIDFHIQNTSIVANNTKDWTPPPNFDANWHFIAVDARFETSGWRHRVSLDGSDWLDLGVDTETDLPDADARTNITMIGNNSAVVVADEIIFWSSGDLFTAQELSNLYQLGNTFNETMDQYTTIFPPGINTISSGINCFIRGKTQTSGDISLFIPGQVETKRLDLFINGLEQISGSIDLHISGSPTIALSSLDLFLKVATPADDDITLFTVGPLLISGGVNNFIQGHQISSGNIVEHIEGHEIITDNINLFVSGIPGNSFDLFISGPVPIDNDIDKIIIGHLPISGNFSLLIKGAFPDIDAFVSVVSNNPPSSLDLIIHGGASGTSFTNKTLTLSINNSIDDILVDSEFSAFVKIADSILTPSSNTWQSFVKNNNVIDNNIDLRIGGHASGNDPNGLLITSSLDIFINGQATQEGDEGLLSDGFSVANTEIFTFAKVHSGLNSTLDLFVSGEIPIIPPSAILDLSIFGILDTVSGSHTLSIPSNESIEDTHDLFIFGVQGIESGNTLLFVEVTNIGLFDQEFNLYTHGF